LANGTDIRYRHAALAGLFIGLSILTKGPVGLLMPLLCIVGISLLKRRMDLFRPVEVVLFLFITLMVSSLWFGIETIKNGPLFLKEFFSYQLRLLTTGDSGHSGPFWFHFVVLLVGCFPASFFIFSRLQKNETDTPKQRDFKTWMIVLLVLVLVVFSLVKNQNRSLLIIGVLSCYLSCRLCCLQVFCTY